MQWRQTLDVGLAKSVPRSTNDTVEQIGISTVRRVTGGGGLSSFNAWQDCTLQDPSGLEAQLRKQLYWQLVTVE
jgi:hypothetical protein